MTDINKFKNWLQSHGCEILPTTNPFEALRFKGAQVGVLYTSGKFNSPYVGRAITCYKTGKGWDGGPSRTGRHPGYKKQKAALLNRDGTKCFFCHKELEDDITVEHLVALSSGGKNELSNMVLAHQQCNQEAGNKPLIEKINICVAAAKKQQHEKSRRAQREADVNIIGFEKIGYERDCYFRQGIDTSQSMLKISPLADFNDTITE